MLILIIIGYGVSCENKTYTKNNDNVSLNSIISPTPTPNKGSESDRLAFFREATKLAGERQYEKAIAEMKKAIDIKPDDTIAYNWIADCYSGLHKYEDQAATYRKILEIDSKDEVARWRLAKLLIETLHQYQEGLKEAKVIEEESTGQDASYVHNFLLAKAYEGVNDKENALKNYKIVFNAVRDAPDSDDYKNSKKKIRELEKELRNSNSKINDHTRAGDDFQAGSC